MKNNFINFGTFENNEKWKNSVKRNIPLYYRDNEIRSIFQRDYTRIIHTTAYRRLRNKTQVFFSPENDHICTRSEHVTHVESISYSIASYLGLNVELTKAIATAHDIGHSPFGHQGEKILSEISEKILGKTFWHEKNGMELVDKIELLEDPYGNKYNLDLTYSVRDGIISHCGEIDENVLKPRNEYIDLYDYARPNQFFPYTWEGCVVKISDKISYLVRDITDAISLGIIDNIFELYDILNYHSNEKINNSFLINEAIKDLCENSSPEKGLCFSDKMFDMICNIKAYNYRNIYTSEKLHRSYYYFQLILTNIFDVLKMYFENKNYLKMMYKDIFDDFEKWLRDYWNLDRNENNKNSVIFDINNIQDQNQSILYYISGMTDNYAINMYNKIIGF